MDRLQPTRPAVNLAKGRAGLRPNGVTGRCGRRGLYRSKSDALLGTHPRRVTRVAPWTCPPPTVPYFRPSPQAYRKLSPESQIRLFLRIITDKLVHDLSQPQFMRTLMVRWSAILSSHTAFLICIIRFSREKGAMFLTKTVTGVPLGSLPLPIGFSTAFPRLQPIHYSKLLPIPCSVP